MRMRDTAYGDCGGQGNSMGKRSEANSQFEGVLFFCIDESNESVGRWWGGQYLYQTTILYVILTLCALLVVAFCSLVCSLATDSSARMMSVNSVSLLQL